jgi:hypothetical protein
MDQSLNAHVKLDVALDVIRIDIRGSLSQDTRPALIELIQRIRRGGISAHIRVELAHAQFVESSALAGLRNDLNAIGNPDQFEVAGASRAAGVSLELQMLAEEFGRVLQPLDLPADLMASADSSGTQPLAGYSYDELLAASDTVFSKLDDPASGAPSDLLAKYDDLSLEISRRERGCEHEPA